MYLTTIPGIFNALMPLASSPTTDCIGVATALAPSAQIVRVRLVNLVALVDAIGSARQNGYLTTTMWRVTWISMPGGCRTHIVFPTFTWGIYV